jgi:calcium-dependent protein kinase
MGCSNSMTKDNPEGDLTSQVFKQRRTLIVDNVDLILKNDALVTDLYEVLGFIGKGGFSSVFKVKHKNSGTVRAIKEFTKDGKTNKLPNEISIQRSMSHPNITKAYEWFEDKDHYYLVTEYLSGGDLIEAVGKFSKFGEVEVAVIMKQLMSSLSYLHSKNVIHRDIKPQNIMLEQKPNNVEIAIKIIDFGLSEYCDLGGSLKEFAGTPAFMAPEMFKGKYNNRSDIWSCGLIMYILLMGESPFEAYLDDDVKFKQIILDPKTVDEVAHKLSNISDGCKAFLLNLLEFDYTKRPSADDCLRDKWLTDYSGRLKSNSNDLDLKKNLSKFLSKNLLQQACSAYLLYHYENAERSRGLRQLFNELDKSGDGRLTYTELKEGFRRLVKDPFLEANFDKVYQQINTHGGEFIEYDEFLRALSNFDELLSDNLLREAFDHFDTDKNGTLEVDNIKAALKLTGGTHEEKEVIDKILMEVDVNRDGVISFYEFKTLMLKIKT